MTRMLKAVVLWSIVLFAGAARATCPDGSAHTHFGLHITNGTQAGCHGVLGVGPQLLFVEVRLYTTPISKVRFSLPDPPFGTLVGTTWNFPFTGDRVNGMEMTLGCTTSEFVTLGSLAITLPPGANVACTSWKVDADCESEDCDGHVLAAVNSPQQWESVDSGLNCFLCWQYCEALPPYNLNPPNGATNVPIDTDLSWGGLQWGDQCHVDLWTNGNCENGVTLAVPCDTRTVSPGVLQPSTTYYWRARWATLSGTGCSSGTIFGGQSIVHSFTTEPPLATEKVTWGAVKVFYRD